MTNRCCLPRTPQNRRLLPVLELILEDADRAQRRTPRALKYEPKSM